MPSFSGGRPAHHFRIPRNNSGHGNVLRVGRGISIYLDLQPSNFWPRHRHPTAQIVLALDPVVAEMVWWRGRKAVNETTTEPHVWCLPPNTFHAAEWTGTAAMVVFYVEPEFIREECGAELSEGFVMSLAPLLVHDYLLTRFRRKFHDQCHRRKLLSEPMLFAGAILLASAVLHTCLGRLASNARTSRCLSERRLEIVARYLESHMRETLTHAILASCVGMGEDTFSRKFKRSTGLSPMKYVWRCRLHHARLLLETGDWKVAQVAAETGFWDQSHLDRRFRKEFGCSPGFVIPAGRIKN